MEWDGRARSEGNGTAPSPAPGLESTVRPLVPQMLVNGLSQRSRPCASGPLINPNAGVRARGYRDQGSSSSGRRWGPAHQGAVGDPPGFQSPPIWPLLSPQLLASVPQSPAPSFAAAFTADRPLCFQSSAAARACEMKPPSQRSTEGSSSSSCDRGSQ